MFGWRLVREPSDPALWSDQRTIAALEDANKRIYPIYRGWVPSSPQVREAAGNVGLCVEGRVRELRGLL